MTLVQLFIFLAVALLTALLRRGRGWLIMIASVLAVFWLQPALPVRQLDFWIPVSTLGLVILTWATTQAANWNTDLRENTIAAGILFGIPLLFGATRFIELPFPVTPSLPPDCLQILIGLLALGFLTAFLMRFLRKPTAASQWIWISLIFLFIAILVIIKYDALTIAASAAIRSLTGQSTALASPLDIRWLGFSYLAFRLIHVLRDRMTGRLPNCSLKDFVVYAIFFPAFLSGPIDRMERFHEDLYKPFSFSTNSLSSGGWRIAIGIFKKFVVADFLALVALNATNAAQISGAIGMWIVLYAYAFRLYFDFSGYTDIAIGIGQWMGFSLPENFNRPYLQSNLTAFWNSWHITLAQWFRSYFFNPLSRSMRSRWRAMPVPLIIFFAQICTMGLIGLWHGITWNFLIWGIWHGIGLFLHGRWSEFSRRWNSPTSPIGTPLREAASTLLTFHYVALGWVWFALPSVDLSWNVFAKLFGMTLGGG
jgi:alginate O-acetyltransferase complex protein AlgI